MRQHLETMSAAAGYIFESGAWSRALEPWLLTVLVTLGARPNSGFKY